MDYYYLINQYGTRRSSICTGEHQAEAWADEAKPNFPGETFSIIVTGDLKSVPAEWVEDKEEYPAFHFVVNEHGLRRSAVVVESSKEAIQMLNALIPDYPHERLQIATAISEEDIPDLCREEWLYFVVNEEGVRRSPYMESEEAAIEYMDGLVPQHEDEAFSVVTTEEA